MLRGWPGYKISIKIGGSEDAQRAIFEGGIIFLY
jgi:hypothetical protein